MQAHDPKAMDSARAIFGDRVIYAADPYSAAHGADALLDHDRVAGVPQSRLRAGAEAAPRAAPDRRPEPLRPDPHDRARASSITGSAGDGGDPHPRHRGRGLHRLAPGRGARAPGRRGRGDRQLRRLLSPRHEGAEPLGRSAPCRGSSSTSRTCWTSLALGRGSRPTRSSCTSPPRRACVRRSPIRWATPQTNVTGTAAVLEAARRAGVSRIVVRLVLVGVRRQHAGRRSGRTRPRSSRSPCTPPPSGRPSCCCSSVAPIYGFRSAALRFFTVYGPRQRPDLAIHAFARRMAAAEPITLFGDGTQARDYTYCDDIVAGVIAAIDWTDTAPIGMEAFNLGGNRSVRTGDMVARSRGRSGSSPNWSGRRCSRATCSRPRPTSPSRAAVLGYAPETPFPEGIRRFVAWFREAYGQSD